MTVVEDDDSKRIFGYLWDGESEAKFTMKKKDYEKHEEDIEENDVLEIKKFIMSELHEHLEEATGLIARCWISCQRGGTSKGARVMPNISSSD